MKTWKFKSNCDFKTFSLFFLADKVFILIYGGDILRFDVFKK